MTLKLKGKRGQPGIETRDLSHPTTLSVNHTTRPLSRKHYRKFLFGARQLKKFLDVSWNITLKEKGKGVSRDLNPGLSHPKILSVNHTTRPLPRKQCQKYIFVAWQLEKIHDVSWNIALKLKGKRGQPAIETRDLSHPTTLSVDHITKPLPRKHYRKFLFFCSTTRKDSCRLLKHSVKTKREKGTAGNWNPGPLAPYDPKCESYHWTTVPQTLPKVSFWCSATQKTSWRLLKHNVKIKSRTGTAGNCTRDLSHPKRESYH